MDRRNFFKHIAAATATAILAKADIAAIPTDEAILPSDSKRNTNPMKIVVLTGSPRRNGNTNYLADRFIAGAKENGHEVVRFDCATLNVAGCIACNHCGMDGDCVLKDNFEKIRPHIIDANMVVFVTPMYYFGFSSQLKRVIDRFYAINGKIKGASKKTAFLMAYADTSEKEAQAMLLHYRLLADYLGWTDTGTVVAPGIWTAGSIKSSRYPEDAYELGKSV